MWGFFHALFNFFENINLSIDKAMLSSKKGQNFITIHGKFIVGSVNLLMPRWQSTK